MAAFLKKHMTGLKVGLASGLFYILNAGSCPCCGQPVSTCAAGFSFAGIAAFLSSGAWIGFPKLKKCFRNLFSRLRKDQ